MRKKRERKVNKRRDKYILQLLIFITLLLFVYVAVAGGSRRRPDPSDETTKKGEEKSAFEITGGEKNQLPGTKYIYPCIAIIELQCIYFYIF